MKRATLSAEPTDLPAAEQDSSELVVFVDLPAREQEIVRTAIGEEYEVCYFEIDSAEQDALSSLVRRGCYLERDGEYYELYGAILDDAVCLRA